MDFIHVFIWLTFITVADPFDSHYFCAPFLILVHFLGSVSSGLDERDAAFMQRLRNLAQEALTWPRLSERQRLVWAAALELNAVPFQELLGDSHDDDWSDGFSRSPLRVVVLSVLLD